MSSYGAEPDASGARFVTREVPACLQPGQAYEARFDPTFSFAEVLRFTGLGRRAVAVLTRAGAADEVPGARGGCEISVTSLEAVAG
jgi:hypothetical protein